MNWELTREFARMVWSAALIGFSVFFASFNLYRIRALYLEYKEAVKREEEREKHDS